MEQGTLQRRTRVAAYCRVATRGGDQSFALAAQEAHYRQMIGENLDWELAGIFTDVGISRVHMKNRRGFHRLMAACRQGRIDMILTKSLSRFARNTVDCLNIVRELKKLGVGVFFEKENINTLADSIDLRVALLSSLAQAESEALDRRPRNHICTIGMIRTTG